MKCTIEFCEKEVFAKGLCGSHYQALRKYGDARKVVQKQHHGKTVKERFDIYSLPGPGCWQWLGYKDNNGYGRLNVKGKPMLASRVSYLLHYGEVPEGHYVCHKCDNPSCVNPEHLFAGTQADNVADMHNKGRDRKRGMPGSKHHASKLNDTAVKEIRQSDAPDSFFAKKFGVSRATIHAVRKGKTWTHLAP